VISKAFAAIMLTFNTIMGFLIFLAGEQVITTLVSNSGPSSQPIVSWFNLWNVMIVPYNYLYPSGTPIPISIIARVYFPTYGVIFMLIVNVLFALFILRKTKEKSP
jgi:ascorbate-specific PTS system EIIC-type component UlaA